MKQTMIILFCSALIAHAADSNTNVVAELSLKQALAWAASSHPDLAEARAQILAASGRVDQAGLWPNPELVGRLESVPFDGDAADTTEYLAGVSQTIPVGGRLSKARQLSVADREVVSQSTQLRWRRITKQVRQSFATGLYQDRAAQLQSQVLSNAVRAVTIARARFAAGDAAMDEVSRAQMEAARARVEGQRSRTLQQQAMSDLMSAMGNPNIKIEGLSGSLEDAFEIPVLEEVAGDILSNPELRVAWADEQAAIARLDMAKTERVPDINVEVLYRRIEGLDANTFDVGLRIPIPAWDRNRGRIAAAQAELAAARIRSRAKAVELGRRVELSQAQLKAALATARSLRTDIVPHASTIRETMDSRLEAGDISLAEFLPVDRDWASVQVTYLESLRDVMVAWAEVRSAMNLDRGID